MSDKLTAWVRTVIPGLWASLLVYLASLGVPAGVLDVVGPLGEIVVYPLALGALYSGLQWLQSRPWLPRWLAVLLAGSAKTPTYVT